jgi:competence protein ComEA
MKRLTFLLILPLLLLPGRAFAADAPPPAGKPAAVVDVNRATEDELIGLPGIGPAKARAIVEHRRRTPFSKVEDLLRVRGIGRGVFRQLRDRVTVGSARAAARAPSSPGDSTPPAAGAPAARSDKAPAPAK